MKKVGIIGGMGPESTVVYYHDIVYGVQKASGKNFFPNLSIESVDVFTVLQLCEEQRYEELYEYLMKAIECLCKCNVDFIILAANTPHIVYDRLAANTSIPIISIIDETAEEAKNQGMERIGLLGTKFTMTGEYYKRPFAQRQINIVTPNVEEMNYIADKITNELELGIVKDDTKVQLCSIINRMKKEEKIEGIVLGCTELPLAINSVNSPVTCLDTMSIHIKSIINRIMN